MSTENVDIVVTEKGSAQAATDIANVGTAAEETAKQTEVLRGGFEALKTTIAGLGLFEIAKQFADISDSFTLLQARLGLVTTGTANLAAVTKELIEQSELTRTSFEANADFFAKVADEANHLGISQEQLAQTQKLLNESFVASGATSAQAAAGLDQLERGFATGSLQGRPLLALLKEFPVTAKALADGLNVPVAALQKLSTTGGISIKQFSDAVIKSGDSINAAFAKIPVTIGQALDVLSERVKLYIAQADQTYDVSGRVAQSILAVANALPALIQALKAATEAYLVWRAALLAQDLYSVVLTGLRNINIALAAYEAAQIEAGIATTVFSRAMVALNTPFASVITGLRNLALAAAANPFLLLIAVLGIAGVAFYNYYQYTHQATEATKEHDDAVGKLTKTTDDQSNAVDNLSAKYDKQGRLLSTLAPLNTDLYDAHQRQLENTKELQASWKKYSDEVDNNAKAIQDNALTTQNALGQMVKATDDWALRSGEAYNQVAEAAGKTATAVQTADTQMIASNQSVVTAAQSSSENTTGTSSGGFSFGYGRGGNDVEAFLGTGQLPAGPNPYGQLLLEGQFQNPNQAAAFAAIVTSAAKAAHAPGFADGGDVVVGGTGGTDSQLVSFMATPGETVSIRNRNQQRRGGNDGGTSIYMTVNTPDANSFKRSTQQILLSTKSKLAQV